MTKLPSIFFFKIISLVFFFYQLTRDNPCNRKLSYFEIGIKEEEYEGNSLLLTV